MSILHIVREYLKDHKYDGLFKNGCGCTLDDLMPCDEPYPYCRAGYEHTDSKGKSIICERKGPLSDAQIADIIHSDE